MKKIKIGGRIFLIKKEETNVFKENQDAYAYIDYSKSEINVRQNQSKDSEVENCLHEILHAIMDNSGVEETNTEQIVKVLTPRLHAFFNDNPDFWNELNKD